MSSLGAAIMIGVCGLSAFFIIADERRGHGAEAAKVGTTASATLTRDISSRRVDPRLLTAAEVFPQPKIELIPGAAPYRVRMTHVDSDCHVATTGKLGQLLDSRGCSQFVRATLVAPTEGYLLTAGIFNMSSEAAALAVHEQAKPLVDKGLGSFAGMPAGPGTESVELPSAQVAWHTRGHFLVYCVTARTDGQIIRDDDPYAQRILYDIVESYLRGTVLERRATAA